MCRTHTLCRTNKLVAPARLLAAVVLIGTKAAKRDEKHLAWYRLVILT